MIDIALLPLTFIKSAIYYTLAAVFWSWVLFVFYVAVMHLQEARDAGRLTTPIKILGYPVVLVGLVLDFAINVVPLSFLFIELPQETTVTARFKRHKYAEGWRGRISRWFGREVLDPLDPSGTHI